MQVQAGDFYAIGHDAASSELPVHMSANENDAAADDDDDDDGGGDVHDAVQIAIMVLMPMMFLLDLRKGAGWLTLSSGNI